MASIGISHGGIRRGFTFNPLVDADWEEVAAAVRLDPDVSPGCGFARKMHKSGRSWPAKDSARSWVVRMYAPLMFPGKLRILTLPGLRWIFERTLLNFRLSQSLETEVWGLENEPAIFKGSLQYMPGVEVGIDCKGSHFVSTSKIAHYELGSLEDFMERGRCPALDAAWVDLTGFITARRVKALKSLWGNVSHSLTVTSMYARHEASVTEKIYRHGGIGLWLARELGAQIIADERTYSEGAPMHQITFRKIPSWMFA